MPHDHVHAPDYGAHQAYRGKLFPVLADLRARAVIACLPDDGATPLRWPGRAAVGTDAPEPISREDLAQRMAEGSVTILDVRPADEFAMGHIPGARNVTLADLEGIAPTLDHGTQIVAYCRGPYCVYSHQAITALRKRGLNAQRLKGGLPEWREDGRMVSV